MKGFVKKIREGNKLDIALQPQGYRQAIEPHAEIILKKLTEEAGFLPFHDKSDPEVIYRNLGISKKAFKKAVGNLLKEKTIRLEPEGIYLNQEASDPEMQ
jgi:predicted RNA-binding protein (virulence factor B family)